MSAASIRGKKFEQEVAKTLQKKLGARVIRDGRSGAGHQRMDISDYYRDTPFDIEVKDQETIKPKEWMRQAEAASSIGRVPTLVFRMDRKAYAMVPFADLIDLAVEIADLRAELDDIRNPKPATRGSKAKAARHIQAARTRKSIEPALEPLIENKRSSGAKACPNGHIADEYGYCMTKGCKFQRGYRPPKGKK